MHQYHHSQATHRPTHMEQFPDHMPTNTRDKILRHWDGLRLEVGLDGHQIVGDALEMAACIVGEKARGVDDVGWSASTLTRTYRRDPGTCKCARTIGTTSQHTCWVES